MSLSELRRLADQATPGPLALPFQANDVWHWKFGYLMEDEVDDARLIVELRNSLPGLLACVEALRAVCAAADEDAKAGYPLPGESAVYISLALTADPALAALDGEQT